MASERVAVATSGKTVDLSNRCVYCNNDMLYRVNRRGRPIEMFCQTYGCRAWLVEIEL